MKNNKIRFALCVALGILSCVSCTNDSALERALYAGFQNPPDDTKPGAYWYWMNDHVSKEGITKDIESMTRIGLGELFIGNIFWQGYEPGDVRLLTPEWEDCMRHAVREGARLGVSIGAFNCPGWSQSGGPWIAKEDAMRYLVYSRAETDGGKQSTLILPRPRDFFQDVATLAFPVVANDDGIKPRLSSPQSRQSLGNLTDGTTSTVNEFANKRGEPVTIDAHYDSPQLKRTLIISIAERDFETDCEVYALQGEEYRLLTSVYFDRSVSKISFGPEPRAPLVVAIGEVTASDFRIVLHKVPENFRLTELKLTSEALLEQYPEKQLHKMANKHRHDWEAYKWQTQTEPSIATVVPEAQVINLSAYLNGDTLKYTFPEGRWQVMRIGMTTTNTVNDPASPEGVGLEIDKMSRHALQSHYDAYVGKIISGISEDEHLNFSRVIADSYETGPENWTDDMREAFVEAYSYDPLPWLAVLSGTIVGSATQSERFLWDLRRLIADRIASEYVGGLQETCERNGTQLWLENYGANGFPSEFLKYGKYAPAIGEEFWSAPDETEYSRLAASACHIYGKNKVYAESYTTAYWDRSKKLSPFEYSPADIKRYGDLSYVNGVNQHIIHLVTHQPDDRKFPGINAWFGLELNRQNTWFEQSVSWIDYQRRCCYMLQQGLPAADVCYFIGEDTPVQAGWTDATLAGGYDHDFINADVLLNDISVKNGRLTLPSGVSYALLVLPPLTTMRPELAERIATLVNEGASILGHPVNRSPSMQDYPRCDERVQDAAKQLWGSDDPDTRETIRRKAGNGNVFCNIPINEALQALGCDEAVRIAADIPVKWKQRDIDANRRIWFLTNQSNAEVSFDADFRITGYRPEWWDAVSGEARQLPDFTVEGGRTVIPLKLDAFESGFVVFVKTGKPDREKHSNYPAETTVADLSGRWDITFDNKWLGEHFERKDCPLGNLSASDDRDIKYFSGTATYTKTFDLKEDIAAKTLYLCIDSLESIATVIVNGETLTPNIWTRPYRLNLTGKLHAGTNTLQVKVANRWSNKIIDQLTGGIPDNPLFMLYIPERFNLELPPSGMWGKVRICSVHTVK